MRIERLIMAMGPLAAMGLGAPALAAIDPIDAIGVCARISKKDARLECFDQVARDAASGQLQRGAPLASGPALAPAPQSWAAPPAPAAQAPRAPAAPAATFGADALRGSGSGDPDSIRAEVTSSTDNGLGQWRIRLADGAIWQMTERVAQFRPPAPREVVSIRKAAMGSFLMNVGQQGSVRVRRVQ